MQCQGPNFFTKTIVINDSTNYLAQVFITTPIYNQCGQVIGSKVSTDTIQQVGPNQYVINIDLTYTHRGSVSWNVTFTNNSVLYPTHQLFQSNIVSTTGIYLGKKGYVSIVANENGIRIRNVRITFTKN